MKPSNVPTGRVTGRFIIGVEDGADPDDEPDYIAAKGTIELQMSVPYIPNPTADPAPVTMLNARRRMILDAEGYACTPDPTDPTKPGARGMRLEADGSPDALVSGWTWNVTYRFDPVNGSAPSIPAHSFVMLPGAVEDLTELVKVPSSPGVGLPQAEAAVLRAEGAAVKSAQSATEAKAAAGTIIEMTETGRLSETALSAAIDGSVTVPGNIAHDAIRAYIVSSAPRPNTWASIGDSISAAGAPVLNSSGQYDLNRRSWQAYANIYLKQRFDPCQVFAISGKRADEMVTEQIPQVLGMIPRPGYCTVMAGTNDINQGRTSAQVITSLDQAVRALVNANIRPIVGVITPRTGFLAGQTTYLNEVNTWLRANVEKMGGILLDWWDTLANPDGTPKTNVHQDGLHPTPYGAALMGQYAADKLTHIAPSRDLLPLDNSEAPNPVLNDNPMMTGTGGTISAGGSGAAASSYKVVGPGGAAYSATLAKVVRYGIRGDWQQATIASGGVQVYAEPSMARFSAGDKVYALIEFESDGITTATDLVAQIVTFTPALATGALIRIGGDTYNGSVIVGSGVLRTPAMTFGAVPASMLVLVKVTGGSGTFRVGRVSVRKQV